MALRWASPSGWPSARVVGTLMAGLLLLTVTAIGADLHPLDLGRALSNAAIYAGQLIRAPDWTYLPDMLHGLWQTLEIAFVATMLTLGLSVPASFLAANNAAPHPIVSIASRGGLSVLRAIPELIWAWIFVIALGLGTSAGVLALTVVGVGMLGKFFAEALEVVDSRTIEGIHAQGGNRLQTTLFALVPQAAPDWISSTLYLFDHNVRAAAIVGLVGAGGIGFDLEIAVRTFQFDRVGMILVGLFGMVAGIDYLSERLRERVT